MMTFFNFWENYRFNEQQFYSQFHANVVHPCSKVGFSLPTAFKNPVSRRN